MKPILPALLAPSLLALLLLAPACGKGKTTTTPTDATGTNGGTATVDEPKAEPPPPQDPDPAELAQGVQKVITGNYEEGIGVLDPIYTGMRQPSQYRASGMAGGWLAVAHAQTVFENADAPSQYALEMAGKLQDPEVEAAAKVGRGAFLLAQEDYPAARQALEAAAAAAPGTASGTFAHLLLAETLIGTAFGSASNTQLEKPEDLDAAKKSYEAALAAAEKAGDAREILLGRAKEGLAAVAKYQNDKTALCANALAAVEHYKTAGASPFLLDGPSQMATDGKCGAKKPK
jgi:tetratricopeptide (TPR) repeat protein